MTGEADKLFLSRVRGRFSGCGDTPTAGSQDSGLLEGGQLRPCAFGSAPRFGGEGHGRRGWLGIEGFRVDWIAEQRKGDARTRKKWWAVGSAIAYHSSYIAGVARQI